MNLDLETLIPTFLGEAEEGLAAAEASLLALEERPGDEEALANAFRSVHTLKGNAAFLGFEGVAKLAHVTEDVLERLRQGRLAVTGDVITLVLHAVDALGGMVPAAAAGHDAPSAEEQCLIDTLSKFASGPSPEGRIAAASSEALEAVYPGDGHRHRDSAPTLRVYIHKLDRLFNVAGEIGIARGQLKQALEAQELDRRRLLDTLEAADFLYLQLQELVMELRMVPVGPTFRRLRRGVRDLARAQGKRAALEIDGEEVEVDTRVIEQLRDPLNHMIRNAIDHGIETEDVRRSRGKASQGRLTLRASHDAGTIVVALSDDGEGLDRERIWQRGLALGLVTEDHAPSSTRVDELVFEPGLSTASEVSALSGRGVGMDVLRRNVESLRGSVQLASEPGQGTTVTVRLPLTLALIDGLEVRVAGETYIVPLEVVDETLGFLRGRQDVDGGVIHLRGEALPYARLRDLLRLEGPLSERQSLIVVRHDDSRAGLLVDELIGKCQTVIKPLAKIFRGIGGLMGSAILGDGRVAFILDVPVLLKRAAEEDTGRRVTHAYKGVSK